MKCLFLLIGFLLSLELQGQNFISNGEFEFGGPGQGFNVNGQGYVYLVPPYPGTTSPGDFAISTNPQAINFAFFMAFGDHTSGSGKMLIIDGGAIGGNQPFWQAGNAGGGVCGLTVGNTYIFSYWVRSASSTVTGVSTQADLQVVFNNATNIQLLSASSLVPLPTVGWEQKFVQFEATNSCVNIALYDANTSITGNDFVIDDIQLMPVGDPLFLTASTQRPNCSDSLSGGIFAYTKGGYPPYTYSLTGVQGTLNNNSGIFCGLPSGTYSLTVLDANNQTQNVNNVLIYANDYLAVDPLDTLVCSNSQVQLTVSGGTNTNYIWAATPPDPNILNPINDTVLVSPSQTTTYTVSTNNLNENLVYNGNFEAMNTGFYTDLNFLTPTNTNALQTSYGITPNASFWENTFSPCVDHTFGNGAGYMMVVDGSISGNQLVWKQQIVVEQNTNYTFSYYVQSVVGTNPAILTTAINGTLLSQDTLFNNACQWEQISVTWYSGQDSIAVLSIFNLNQNGIGNDFAIDDISFSTIRSCTNHAIINIIQGNPDLGLNYPNDLCLNSGNTNPTLFASTPLNGTYSSSPAGLNLDPISGVISASGSSAGIYQVVYSVSICNSIAKDTVSITMHALPTLISLTGGTYNCTLQSFDSVLLYLSASFPASVSWTLNGLTQNTQGMGSPIFLGTDNGLYDLLSVSDLYCSSTLTGSILLDSLIAPQTPSIVGDLTICQNELPGAITLSNANPNGVISWFGDSSLTQYIDGGNLFYPNNDSSTSYYVVQTVNGCVSDVLAFYTQVIPCNLVVPSAFTPDGDGVNDIWEIIGLDGKFPLNQVMIYNRWGELLFTSIEGNYASKPWDGTLNGEKLPAGSYYYIIEKAVDGSIEPINGTISILRVP